MDGQEMDEVITDLVFATSRTLKAICQQLIDKGAINREILLADLVQVQMEVSQKVEGPAAFVPARLYAELGGQFPAP
jgi:hypothetical protein